ncbi:Mediator of RNA polymerase II transcription subunit 7 [Ascosphaera aggregata]|nr:Mediator of RNA polymerase II transcription subunit 7 [Ascosphaera aggregata]
MADQTVKPAVTAAFPPPPPFWKHFTRENIEKFEEFKAKRAAAKIHDGYNNDGMLNDASKEDDRDRDRNGNGNGNGRKRVKEIDFDRLREEVPFELRYLVPPAIPKDTYELFGEVQQVSMTLPSLTSQGINQVFPDPPTTTTAGIAVDEGQNGSSSSINNTNNNLPANPQFWLCTISKYLLLNFLELSGLLASMPAAAKDKIEDIRNLFVNAHHLLNMYRPHQARETFILMLEEQIRKSREEIEEMKRVEGNVEGVLRRLEEEGRNHGGREKDSERGRKGEGVREKREVSSDDGLFEEAEEEEEEEEREEMQLGREDGNNRIGRGKAELKGMEEWKEMWEVLGSGWEDIGEKGINI